jgi:hypothetical protein
VYDFYLVLKIIMKTITLFIALLSTTDYLLAQTKERFCILKIMRSNQLEEIYAAVDSGQLSIYNANFVSDSNGKKRNFVTEAKALNYISSCGWKIVPMRPEFDGMLSNKGVFLFKKEE